MALLQATERLHGDVQRRSVAAMLLARREWQRIDPAGDWLAQWLEISARLTALLIAAQVGAAKDAAASVATALVEAGHPERKIAEINPGAFAGWVVPSWTGEDGIELNDFLLGPVSTARNASGTPAQMLATGGQVLEKLAQYAVSEAAAQAHDVQVVATRNTYSVFVEPGSMCQRCAVLVGKHYRPGTHVKRHPGCDGVMQAVSESGSYTYDLKPSQIKDLTKAQQVALDEGADLNQVINSHRQGALSGAYTTEGTTRRGFGYFAIQHRHSAFDRANDVKKSGARYASSSIGRLSPETIYRVAKDRTDMVRLLRTYGYIVK